MPPVTPEEVVNRRLKDIPEAVIEAWNGVIAKYFQGSAKSGSSRFVQDEAVDAIIEAMGCDRKVVFDNHWLDIESLYRDAGWSVTYDRPGYNESYDPTFEFRVKR